MKKPVFLYLDDEVFDPSGHRSPERFYQKIGNPEMVEKMSNYSLVKFINVPQVKEYILNNGCPDFISFDNDLGEKLEGIDLAKWLVDSYLETPGFIPQNFEFFVHSRNTIAKDRIYSLLDNYLSWRTSNNLSDKNNKNTPTLVKNENSFD